MAGESEDMASRYQGYVCWFEWDSAEPMDRDNDHAVAKLRTKDQTMYSANCVTPRFIQSMFEKNRQTKENNDAAYFAMPGMLVLRRLDAVHLRRTIDHLIDMHSIEQYFRLSKDFSIQ